MRCDDIPYDKAAFHIGEFVFETVADFDAYFSLGKRNDEDRTVIFAFLSEFPCIGDSDAERFERIACKRCDGQNCDLSACRLFERFEIGRKLFFF